MLKIVLIFFLFVEGWFYNNRCQDIRSLTRPQSSLFDLYNSHPEHFARIFDHLQLELTGLEAVKTNLAKWDTLAAAHALLTYYESSHKSDWIFESLSDSNLTGWIDMANKLLKDTVVFNGTKAIVPKTSNGHWDWKYTCPDQDAPIKQSWGSDFELSWNISLSPMVTMVIC